MSEYTMTKEDWQALYVLWQLAAIVCTRGVTALRDAPTSASHE